jgi:hypothetical protein
MLPAPSLATILDRSMLSADLAGSALAVSGRRRLVSILLATPDSWAFDELRSNTAYFNARSGMLWDLYVAGYYAYGGQGYDSYGYPINSAKAGSDSWWFSPTRFRDLHVEISQLHSLHLAKTPLLRGRRLPWSYSGRPEIVNLWATGTEPDWDSLVAHQLEYGSEFSLGSVVETHTEWESIPLPKGFEPGSRAWQVTEKAHIETLRRGLQWAVAGAAGAALAEGVSELLHALTQH